jgi:hypothetical protein
MDEEGMTTEAAARDSVHSHVRVLLHWAAAGKMHVEKCGNQLAEMAQFS